jgi:hypothetical protein
VKLRGLIQIWYQALDGDDENCFARLLPSYLAGCVEALDSMSGIFPDLKESEMLVRFKDNLRRILVNL